MILLAKVLVDAIPHMTQDLSWTITNLGYMAVSFVMFHHVTGVPFESRWVARSVPCKGASRLIPSHLLQFADGWCL